MWIFGCSDLSFGALYDDHYGLVIDSVIDLVIHAYFFDFFVDKRRTPQLALFQLQSEWNT